ncbi:MAG: sulfotransferase, partial [Myxococcota bacterium]
REQLALWERGIRRTLAAREEHPERFLDVHFGELRSDPLGVLRRIEARLGGELTPRDEAALSAWLEAQPRTPHHYEAERFGLTPGAIRERFVDYIETCGVALEG